MVERLYKEQLRELGLFSLEETQVRPHWGLQLPLKGLLGTGWDFWGVQGQELDLMILVVHFQLSSLYDFVIFEQPKFTTFLFL